MTSLSFCSILEFTQTVKVYITRDQVLENYDYIYISYNFFQKCISIITGELIEMYGLARVTVSSELKVQKIEIHYKPDEFMEVLHNLRPANQLSQEHSRLRVKYLQSNRLLFNLY